MTPTTLGCMSERVILEPGNPAPSFSLTDQHGNEVTLESFTGKKLVIFFYPSAMTPGCTKQACDFRDSIESLKSAGYEVIGISPDSVERQLKFTERDSLTYPLLSDEDKSTLVAYGAFGEKKLYGKVVEGVIRSTFVLDEAGVVEHALYNVKATGHVARIRKLLGIDA